MDLFVCGFSCKDFSNLKACNISVYARGKQRSLLGQEGSSSRTFMGAVSYMKTHHPDMVVPKSEFGDRINTLGEIYREEAEDILNALLDDIAQRYPTD